MSNLLSIFISRKSLITGIVIDVFIFIIIFKKYFIKIFNVNYLQGTILFLLIFIAINYICGKYQDYNKHNFRVFLRLIKKLFISFFIFSVIFYSYTSILILFSYDYSLVNIFYDLFTVYFLGYTSKYFIDIFFLYRSNLKMVWFYLGSFEKYQILNKEISKVDSFQRYEIIYSNDDLNNNQFESIEGYIIGDEYKMLKQNFNKLSFYKNKKIKIIKEISWFERYLNKIPSNILSENYLFDENFLSKEFYSSQVRIKRLGDVLISTFLLVCSIPIILIAGILIKLEDGGPVFYKQKRNGINENIFNIYKLRTMRVNAEKDGIQWSNLKDERVTKIGRYLRLIRFDELPQLLQVLSGDMSLIGPRPERPEFDQILSNEIPHYKLRYSVRPGISGWAQVNYHYGSSTDDSKEKLSFDLFYLKNYSIWLDFLILFKTIRLVSGAKGSLPKKANQIL